MSNKKTVWSTVAGILSSVLAFLGIVSCCGMPVLAGILAAFGIGASQLSFFAEYRGWFIGFAIVSLLFGFYQSYFRSCTCCGNDSEEAKRKKARSVAVQRVFLWIGAMIVAALLFVGRGGETTSTGCCPAQSTETSSAGCCGNADKAETPSCCGSSQPTTCCPAETEREPAGNCCGQ
ncbi:MAG: hypothetical protein NC324_10400 [Bacteroides sp.]|nr:hypothetical protein [Bacteroides sp.]